jgi:hypothetical protein
MILTNVMPDNETITLTIKNDSDQVQTASVFQTPSIPESVDDAANGYIDSSGGEYLGDYGSITGWDSINDILYLKKRSDIFYLYTSETDRKNDTNEKAYIMPTDVANRIVAQATVGGTNAEHVNVTAAKVAGIDRMIMVSDTNDPSGVNLGTGDTYIYILPNVKWTVGDVITASSVNSLKIESIRNNNTDGGTISFAFSSAKKMISEANLLEIRNIRFDNNSTANGAWSIYQSSYTKTIIDNCRFELPNQNSCGVFAGGGAAGFHKANISSNEFIGGGGNCYNALQTANVNQFCFDNSFSGTYSTAASQYAIITFNSVSTKLEVSCMAQFRDFASGIINNGGAAALVVDLGRGTIAGVYLKTGSVNLIQNNTILTGARLWNGNISVRTGVDYCNISSCQAAGALNTITVNANCDKTVVSGCITTIAIVNNGTNTKDEYNDTF